MAHELFPSCPSGVAALPPTEREFRLSYQDVNQGGWMTAMALPQALGEVFWRGAARESGVFDALGRQGVLPILTRLTLAPDEGPVSIFNRVQGKLHHRIAQCRDNTGAVERLVLDVWVDLFAARDRIRGERPEPGRIRCGRVYAEHVFTRPFAARADRKVRRFDVDGLPAVPEMVRGWKPPDDLLDAPGSVADPGSDFVGAATPLVSASGPLALGMDDTDENQHVNFLVYPRWFQQEALRLLAAEGRDVPGRALLLETTFRKPLFAGDRVIVALKSVQIGGHCGAVGCFLPAEVADHPIDGKTVRERAYAYGRVLFSRLSG